MITGVHHFAIIVSSEESVMFYEKLGFKESFRRERSYDTVVLLDGYGIQIEMFIDPNHPERATEPENLGLRPFALRIDSIEETIKELKLEPATITTDWVGLRFCNITDPDGLPIELHE